MSARSRSFGYSAAILALAALTHASSANFAGYYAFTGPAEGSAATRLKVRVLNGGDAEIQAFLYVEDPANQGTDFGSFTPVTIPGRGAAVARGEFTIPAAELQRWKDGGLPRVRIEFDAAGQWQIRSVDLLRTPTPID